MNSEKTLLLYLRRVIGFSFLFTIPLCAIVDSWGIKFPGYFRSLSTAYWTNSRPIFTIVLGLVGIFMCLYEGYDIYDRIVNITAGISTLCIVLFPAFNPSVLDCDPKTNYDLFPTLNMDVSTKIHIVVTFIAFTCYIVNCLCLFTKNKGEITEKKKLRNKIYKTLGWIMVAVFVIMTAYVFTITFVGPLEHVPICTTIVCQTIELICIGLAWLIKGEALTFFNDEE